MARVMTLILFMVKCVSVVPGDMFSCNAEEESSHNKQCRLRQDHTDDFDWIRTSGITHWSRRYINFLNKDPITGPASAKAGRYYLYAGQDLGYWAIARQEFVHSN